MPTAGTAAREAGSSLSTESYGKTGEVVTRPEGRPLQRTAPLCTQKRTVRQEERRVPAAQVVRPGWARVISSSSGGIGTTDRTLRKEVVTSLRFASGV